VVICVPEGEGSSPSYYVVILILRKRNGPLTPTGLADVISTTAGSLSTDLPSPLTFPSREPQLRGFSKGLITNSLRLLVAVSGLLSPEDHESLCGFLWQSCLTQAPYEIQTSVSLYFVGFVLSVSDVLPPPRLPFCSCSARRMLQQLH
jgi:hypothetical protein